MVNLDPQSAEASISLFNALKQKGAIGQWKLPDHDAQAAIDIDGLLAKELAAQDEQTYILRIWRNQHALVVPRNYRLKAGFDEAVGQMQLPVALRRSGGTAVIHGPHVLNISLITKSPRCQPISIPNAFAQLGDLIIGALSEIGVQAEMADTHGAHCPGRYSIAVSGKKLAGTAAFVFDTGDIRATVTHASLALAGNNSDLENISAFEQALGMPGNYELDAHACLASTLSVVLSV